MNKNQNNPNNNGKREKTIVWSDPIKSMRDAFETSGLEYLNAIKDGQINAPPVAALVGYKIIEVQNGFAVFELNPEEFHYNPFSTVHGGILSTLLDTTMTASVLSTLPIGASCATVEIKVNFIKPVTEQTEILNCEAKPIHIGKRLATAEGKVKDRNNNLIAHGVSTCSIFKIK